MSMVANELIKVPPGPERDALYSYPYTGPYDEEVSDYELRHRAEYRSIWGKNSLAVSHECWRCGSKDTEWIRQDYSICYNCLTIFTLDEALDYNCFLQEEQDKQYEDRQWKW